MNLLERAVALRLATPADRVALGLALALVLIGCLIAAHAKTSK